MATVPELIRGRQTAVSKDWGRFLRYPLLYFGRVVNRKNANLPPDFVPWAPGIIMANDYLLRLAGYHPTSGRPKGWRLQPSRGDYEKGSSIIRKRGKFWTVEAFDQYVLVFTYGSMPICTRTFEE